MHTATMAVTLGMTIKAEAMQTNRECKIYKPSLGYSITAPEGAEVIVVKGAGGGYALAFPTKYGASQHDAVHYYFFVPSDAVKMDPS